MLSALGDDGGGADEARPEVTRSHGCSPCPSPTVPVGDFVGLRLAPPRRRAGRVPVPHRRRSREGREGEAPGRRGLHPALPAPRVPGPRLGPDPPRRPARGRHPVPDSRPPGRRVVRRLHARDHHLPGPRRHLGRCRGGPGAGRRPYAIPDRDCGGHSQGGAPDLDAYDDWIDRFAAGLGSGDVIVVLEPDSVARRSACPPVSVETASPRWPERGAC